MGRRPSGRPPEHRGFVAVKEATANLLTYLIEDERERTGAKTKRWEIVHEALEDYARKRGMTAETLRKVLEDRP